MPKISVLMPIYKTNPAYLSQAIESILLQTFIDFEFIILDDCPDDSRENIVKQFKDSRINYICNEKNIGISGSRNKLLSLSKGEYLAIFDHDDISLSTRFEKQVKYLDSHPEVGVVSSNMKMIHSGEILKNPEGDLAIKSELFYGCVVAHTASMIRKNVLTKYNLVWEEEYSPCEDYMLWARLIDKTMFYNIQEVLVNYRDHSQNTSNLQKEKMKDRDWLIKNFIYKKFPRGPFKSYEWIYLFGLIPFLKIRSTLSQKRYSLFGLFPLFMTKKSKC